MDIINHQSNGAKGLRIAATICVVLGWLYAIVGLIVGLVSEYIKFFASFGAGVVSLGVMYLIACVLRALASLAEVAQIYYNKNVTDPETEDE